jgi:phospholipid/cholesterol/gamma-HCH transport system substrate-binding protein
MKKEIKLGLFLMVVFVIFAYFIIKTQSCSEIFSKGQRYPVHAKFLTVAGMYTTAPVRLAGIKIGIVDKIYLENRKAGILMMIDNKYRLLTDARAIISTIGFVGEKYVEIVYKDEFSEKKPGVIQPGGEIFVIEPFNLDEVKTKFDNIYERIIQITDSVNDVISDKYSKESLRVSFVNLKDVTESLKSILAEKGQLNKVFEGLQQFQDKLARTAEAIDHFVHEMDSAFTDNQGGILKDLKAAGKRIDALSVDLAKIGSDLQQGKGTAGKLLQDEQLYKKIDESVSVIHKILGGLKKDKNNLDATLFNYAVHFDYFSRLKQGRVALDLDLRTASFQIMTGINEDPANGRPLFTALGGKKIAFFNVAAGLVESNLGAALSFNMLNRRLNLDVYAYRFSGGKNPLLKTILRFSLSKNIRIQAGYYDLLQVQKREFMMGISFGN